MVHDVLVHVFIRIGEAPYEKDVQHMVVDAVPPLGYMSPQSTFATNFSVNVFDLEEEVVDNGEYEWTMKPIVQEHEPSGDRDVIEFEPLDQLSNNVSYLDSMKFISNGSFSKLLYFDFGIHGKINKRNRK